ncbi:MAG: thiamine phosphate synthase [Muribaculaceae bacterium]|nr:thiamine phosphate synthase [Muribaculaceae bacterium]
MADKFLSVIFTESEIRPNEAQELTQILESGACDWLHLRHPAASEQQMQALLDSIPNQLRSKIRIHSHFSLIDEFGLAGAHLNSRWQEWDGDCSFTRSCHASEELSNCGQYAYSTLSPIFPSISKPGYKADFELASLSDAISQSHVVALGGVTPDKTPLLQALGFEGAAYLGYAWQGDLLHNLRQIKIMPRFSLQYITNGVTPAEVAEEVEAVLKGGCKWVQIRMKDASDATVAEAADKCKPLIDRHHAILLLDDHPELAKAVGADGVHLGKNDMPPSEARAILGPYAIIGSTANTLEDIANILAHGQSDYIGLGPLRFTSTKKNLSPTLGYDGYARILAQPVGLPVVAIGSVGIDDVAPLLSRGASGVAVSGAIRRATSPQTTTARFVSALSDCALASVKHN